MKRILCSLASAIVLSTAAQGAAFTYSAVLSGAGSAGTGSTTVFYNDVTHLLRVTANFSGLTGDTTASHIHCCVAPPGNAGVATQLPSFLGFPLGVKSGSFDNTYNLALDASWNPGFITSNGGTAASAEAALAAGLGAGRAYLNIHTTAAPGGEIRGNLVPEPSTMGLGLLALGGLFVARKRLKRG